MSVILTFSQIVLDEIIDFVFVSSIKMEDVILAKLVWGGDGGVPLIV